MSVNGAVVVIRLRDLLSGAALKVTGSLLRATNNDTTIIVVVLIYIKITPREWLLGTKNRCTRHSIQHDHASRVASRHQDPL